MLSLLLRTTAPLRLAKTLPILTTLSSSSTSSITSSITPPPSSSSSSSSITIRSKHSKRQINRLFNKNPATLRRRKMLGHLDGGVAYTDENENDDAANLENSLDQKPNPEAFTPADTQIITELLTHISTHYTSETSRILTNGWAPPSLHLQSLGHKYLPVANSTYVDIEYPKPNGEVIPFHVERTGGSYYPIYKKSGVNNHKLSTSVKCFKGDLKMFVAIVEGTIDILEARGDIKAELKKKDSSLSDEVIDIKTLYSKSDLAIIQAIGESNGVPNSIAEIRQIKPSSTKANEYTIEFKGDCVRVVRGVLCTLGF